MNCQELTEFIMAYLEGELDPATRLTFDHHLRRCPACVAFIETYRESISLGREAFRCEDGAPCQVPEDLVKAILDAVRGRRPGNEPGGGGCGCGG